MPLHASVLIRGASHTLLTHPQLSPILHLYCPCAPRPALQLTAEEQHFLDSASDEVKRQFETAGKAIGEAAVMSMASGGAGAGAGAAKAGGR